MSSVTIYTSAEVDLSEIDTDELIKELAERKEVPHQLFVDGIDLDFLGSASKQLQNNNLKDTLYYLERALGNEFWKLSKLFTMETRT